MQPTLCVLIFELFMQQLWKPFWNFKVIKMTGSSLKQLHSTLDLRKVAILGANWPQLYRCPYPHKAIRSFKSQSLSWCQSGHKTSKTGKSWQRTVPPISFIFSRTPAGHTEAKQRHGSTGNSYFIVLDNLFSSRNPLVEKINIKHVSNYKVADMVSIIENVGQNTVKKTSSC